MYLGVSCSGEGYRVPTERGGSRAGVHAEVSVEVGTGLRQAIARLLPRER